MFQSEFFFHISELKIIINYKDTHISLKLNRYSLYFLEYRMKNCTGRKSLQII